MSIVGVGDAFVGDMEKGCMLGGWVDLCVFRCVLYGWTVLFLLMEPCLVTKMMLIWRYESYVVAGMRGTMHMGNSIGENDQAPISSSSDLR